jgi:hypothetical protein
VRSLGQLLSNGMVTTLKSSRLSPNLYLSTPRKRPNMNAASTSRGAIRGALTRLATAGGGEPRRGGGVQTAFLPPPAAALDVSEAWRPRSVSWPDVSPAGLPQPSAHLGSRMGPGVRQALHWRVTCRKGCGGVDGGTATFSTSPHFQPQDFRKEGAS